MTNITKHMNIHVPKNTHLGIVGDIHEHKQQFNELIGRLQPSEKMFFVSVGDILDKGGGIQHAEEITDVIRSYHEAGQAYMVRGNHELKHIRKARNQQMTPQLQWLARQPLALSFIFENGSRVTVVHAGVKPSHTWDDLTHDVEVCYIRTIDEEGKMIPLVWVQENGQKVLRPAKPGGKSWHELYDGRFGYIAAGHEPQKDGVAKFYNYSCNLDTACYDTGILTCQIFSEGGREELIQISGPKSNWHEAQ